MMGIKVNMRGMPERLYYSQRQSLFMRKQNKPTKLIRPGKLFAEAKKRFHYLPPDSNKKYFSRPSHNSQEYSSVQPSHNDGNESSWLAKLVNGIEEQSQEQSQEQQDKPDSTKAVSNAMSELDSNKIILNNKTPYCTRASSAMPSKKHSFQQKKQAKSDHQIGSDAKGKTNTQDKPKVNMEGSSTEANMEGSTTKVYARYQRKPQRKSVVNQIINAPLTPPKIVETRSKSKRKQKSEQKLVVEEKKKKKGEKIQRPMLINCISRELPEANNGTLELQCNTETKQYMNNENQKQNQTQNQNKQQNMYEERDCDPFHQSLPQPCSNSKAGSIRKNKGNQDPQTIELTPKKSIYQKVINQIRKDSGLHKNQQIVDNLKIKYGQARKYQYISETEPQEQQKTSIQPQMRFKVQAHIRSQIQPNIPAQFQPHIEPEFKFQARVDSCKPDQFTVLFNKLTRGQSQLNRQTLNIAYLNEGDIYLVGNLINKIKIQGEFYTYSKFCSELHSMQARSNSFDFRKVKPEMKGQGRIRLNKQPYLQMKTDYPNESFSFQQSQNITSSVKELIEVQKQSDSLIERLNGKLSAYISTHKINSKMPTVELHFNELMRHTDL